MEFTWYHSWRSWILPTNWTVWCRGFYHLHDIYTARCRRLANCCRCDLDCSSSCTNYYRSTFCCLVSCWPPQGTSPSAPEVSAVTTSFTIVNIGPNGLPTPVVQTVVLTPAPVLTATGAGIPFPLPSGPVIDTAQIQTPSLSAYGPELSGFPTIGVPFPPNLPSIFSNGLPPLITGPLSGILTGPGAGTPTPVSNPFDQSSNLGIPGFPLTPGATPPSYGSDLNDGAVRPDPSGPLPTDATLWPSAVAYNTPSAASPALSLPCTTLKTSTWVNIIPEQTTTYTLNYPFTTLAAVTSPVKLRGFRNIIRRQLSSAGIDSQWSNSTTPISTPSATSPVLQSPTLCSSGGNIGNYTLDFDDIEAGPLYNPAGDFWFSQGFSVVPPSSQTGAYSPSSGGQLIEFVPPSSLGSIGSGSSDTAEIGVGPNFAIPCYKFNIYGLNLGCAAQSSEQWCEFEIAAYAYDENSRSEQSLSWSETKRVPACPNYPTGACSLTSVDLDGYSNVTSVLISLRVGLESRTWWADDLRVGWTDNSCEAASCRADSSFVAQKRSTQNSLRRRLWELASTKHKRSLGRFGGNATH
uniref:DUF7371 domain-containing protein n=1 Tax=Bionectria ochroleuca TaxID=29856 RepID=A0A8H7K2B1_BIOOC